MKTYKESFIVEGTASQKLIDALYKCLDEAPDRARNRLAQEYEDYASKYIRASQRRQLGPLLSMILDTIEEATAARVDRDDW